MKTYTFKVVVEPDEDAVGNPAWHASKQKGFQHPELNPFYIDVLLFRDRICRTRAIRVSRRLRYRRVVCTG